MPKKYIKKVCILFSELPLTRDITCSKLQRDGENIIDDKLSVRHTPNFRYITDKRLSIVTFSVKDIREIIQNVDLKKAHGHDINIRTLKICGDSICKPLQMVFSQAVLSTIFSF